MKMLQFLIKTISTFKKSSHLLFIHTCISKKFLRGTPRPSTQCDKVYRGKKTGAEFVLSSQTANCSLQLILLVLASNCSHTPMSSMKSRTMRFLSITGVPCAEMGIQQSLNKHLLNKRILRSLAVSHLCWSAMEGQVLGKEGLVQQYRRCVHLSFFFLTTFFSYNLLKSKHKFRCVASTESHSELHSFAEQKEIQIQEFSLNQVNIFRLPRPLTFILFSITEAISQLFWCHCGLTEGLAHT